MKDKLRELAEWMRGINGHCADALTEILDAEGDGRAVAWMSPNKERLEFSRPDTVYGSHTIPLYTHPARSGVVSEKAVLDARRAAYAYDTTERVFIDVDTMRAALEHFAKGERHER